VEAIAPPGMIPPVSPGNYAARSNPLPPSVKRSLDFRNLRQIVETALIVTCIILTVAEMITDYLLLVPVFLVIAALFLVPGESDGVKKRRRADLKSTRYLWELWNKKWIAEAGDASFHAQLSQLRELKWKYENLERGYRAGLLALEQTTRDRQVKKILMRWSTDSCSLPRLTPAMIGHLKAAGIRSAADMTPASLRRVPQIDNTLINELLLWREKMERNFLFDPTQGIDSADLQALIHQYQPLMRPVERDLTRGILKLQKVQGDILKKRVLIRPEIEKRARELAQAEADFEVFARTPEELIRRDIERLVGVPGR
jgi:DNA-binding helix-hairpin-helix protein with protein kinase domain